MRKLLKNILLSVLVLMVLAASVFSTPSAAFASDKPVEYNSKMVKAYGSYGSLYTALMAAFGANTYEQFYKPATDETDGWEFTYYWKNPMSGSSVRRWNDLSHMDKAGVLPQAGDIIIFCKGNDISRNSAGDPISTGHIGICVTDTDEDGVYYTIDYTGREDQAVQVIKWNISGSYTDYNRMDIDLRNNNAHLKIYAVIHNTSDYVRDLMTQTAYYERSKYLSDKEGYCRQLYSDIRYNKRPNFGFAARVSLELATVGTILFRATTSFSRSGRSFNGAEYRVYTDPDCTIPAGPLSQTTFRIKENGNADKTIVLAPGDYYLKQMSAPLSGKFFENTTVSPFTVISGRSYTATGGNLVQIPKELKAYFIGNSYTNSNSMPTIVSSLFKEDGMDLRTYMHAINESGLYQHVENEVVKAAISSGEYDFVILQESSVSSVGSPRTSAEYIKTMMSWAPSSTQFLLYETMSYRDHPEDQIRYDEAYGIMSDITGATVIHAGEAFWTYASEHPYTRMFTDEKHPTYTGSKVIAECICETIYDLPAFTEYRLSGLSKRSPLSLKSGIIYLP